MYLALPLENHRRQQFGLIYIIRLLFFIQFNQDYLKFLYCPQWLIGGHSYYQISYLTDSHQISLNLTKSHRIPSNPAKSQKISTVSSNLKKSHQMYLISMNFQIAHQISLNLTKSHQIASNLTISLTKTKMSEQDFMWDNIMGRTFFFF